MTIEKLSETLNIVKVHVHVFIYYSNILIAVIAVSYKFTTGQIVKICQYPINWVPAE